MVIVARISRGHKLVARDGTTWEVIGSRSLRGVYRYILKCADGTKVSLRRDFVLDMQREGNLKVTA